jgi:hypothetical protein
MSKDRSNRSAGQHRPRPGQTARIAALPALMAAFAAMAITAPPTQAYPVLNPAIMCGADHPTHVRATRQRSERQNYWQWAADSSSNCHRFNGADDYDYDIQVRIMYELHRVNQSAVVSRAWSPTVSYTLPDRTARRRLQPATQSISTCARGLYVVRAEAYFRYRPHGSRRWVLPYLASGDYQHLWSRQTTLC